MKKQKINPHRDDIHESLTAESMREILALPESAHMSTMVARGKKGNELMLVTRNAHDEFTARVSVCSYPEAVVFARAIIEAAGIAWPNGEAEMAQWRADNPDPREC